jgi:hypothetical protein
MQKISDQAIELHEEFELVLDAEQNLICSFCGKSRFDVDLLIKGNDAFICDECVIICLEIIEDK